jgi:predicted nuclease of predicted toxin-antitoxin system
VKFLIDNQLPLALATMLTSKGHRASHVLDLGLEAATDSEIWNYAAANSLVLITKDEDFSYRASQPNASVQVVWVRRGNCRKAALLAAFDSVLSRMEAALKAGDSLVEIR